MRCQFRLIPSFVAIRTEQLPEKDDVEQDNRAGQTDHHEDCQFLSPGHPHIRSLHSSKMNQQERRDPPGQHPCDSDPPSSSIRRRHDFRCMHLFLLEGHSVCFQVGCVRGRVQRCFDVAIIRSGIRWALGPYRTVVLFVPIRFSIFVAYVAAWPWGFIERFLKGA